MMNLFAQILSNFDRLRLENCYELLSRCFHIRIISRIIIKVSHEACVTCTVASS